MKVLFLAAAVSSVGLVLSFPSPVSAVQCSDAQLQTMETWVRNNVPRTCPSLYTTSGTNVLEPGSYLTPASLQAVRPCAANACVAVLQQAAVGFADCDKNINFNPKRWYNSLYGLCQAIGAGGATTVQDAMRYFPGSTVITPTGAPTTSETMTPTRPDKDTETDDTGGSDSTESSASKEESSASKDESSASKDESSASKDESSASKDESSTSKQNSPAAKEESPASIKTTDAPPHSSETPKPSASQASSGTGAATVAGFAVLATSVFASGLLV